MARPRRGQINQFIFPMVDGTDFATIESGLVASDLTGRYFGVNHGTSTAQTSGAIAAARIALVRSGLFRLTATASVCNFDHITFRFTATGAAVQFIPVDFVTNTGQNVYSAVSDMRSNIESILTGLSGNISDVYSQLSDARSNIESVLAGLSDNVSNVDSAVSSQFSQIQSMLLVMSGVLSDFESNFSSRVPELVANDSDLSNFHSDLRSLISGIGGGTASNIASVVWATAVAGNQSAGSFGSTVEAYSDAISNMHSDLRSLVSTAGGTTASDVWSRFQSITGRTVSAFVSDMDSQFTALSGMISDVDSAMTSQFTYLSNAISDAHSDIRSIVSTAGGTTASDVWSRFGSITGVGVSQFTSYVSDQLSNLTSRITSQAVTASDLVSQIWAHSAASNIQSATNQLSNIHSDLRSLVSTAGGTTASDVWSRFQSITGRTVSAFVSDMDSQFTALSGMISDVDSALTSQHSDIKSEFDALSNQLSNVQSALSAQISDVDSALTSQHSDIKSEFDALSDQLSNAQSALSAQISDVESALDSVAQDVWEVPVSNFEVGIGDRTPGMAVMKAVNRTRVDSTAGTLDIYRTDGTTIAASQALTTSDMSDVEEFGGVG